MKKKMKLMEGFGDSEREERDEKENRRAKLESEKEA